MYVDFKLVAYIQVLFMSEFVISYFYSVLYNSSHSEIIFPFQKVLKERVYMFILKRTYLYEADCLEECVKAMGLTMYPKLPNSRVLP